MTTPNPAPKHQAATKSFQLSDSTYDFLNAWVKYFLPALGTFYFTLAQIWKLPYSTEVVGTIAALALLFGVVLFLSKRAYITAPVEYDGVIAIQNTDEPGVSQYNVSIPIDAIQKKDVLTVRVQPPS